MTKNTIDKDKKLLKTIFNKKLILNYLEDDRYIGGQIASTGRYEPYESYLILNYLKSGDMAVDIGANIGYYTLLFADKVGPNGKVYAFEPDPINFSILEKNIKVNKFKNITSKEIGISNQPDFLYLFQSEENYGGHHFYPDSSSKNKVKVECNSLDNLLSHLLEEQQRIKLIKIDTEGFEPFVVEGCKKIIKAVHPVIFFEYWPYGFRNSGADPITMLNYLKKEYKCIYFIDDINELIFETDQKYIDNYCKQLNGYLHCNLFCVKKVSSLFFR